MVNSRNASDKIICDVSPGITVKRNLKYNVIRTAAILFFYT